MQHTNRWLIVMLFVLTALLLAACGGESTESSSSGDEPAYAEPVEGTEFNQVVLTDSASQRLDIQTDVVREEEVDGRQRLVLPYSSIIYGLNGETWAYVSTAPLTFMREPVMVDYIEGDLAVLSDGPAAGTEVAAVGVAELYGIDTGVGK